VVWGLTFPSKAQETHVRLYTHISDRGGLVGWKISTSLQLTVVIGYRTSLGDAFQAWLEHGEHRSLITLEFFQSPLIPNPSTIFQFFVPTLTTSEVILANRLCKKGWFFVSTLRLYSILTPTDSSDYLLCFLGHLPADHLECLGSIPAHLLQLGPTHKVSRPM
jgi:hypothetical protein